MFTVMVCVAVYALPPDRVSWGVAMELSYPHVVFVLVVLPARSQTASVTVYVAPSFR